MVESLNRQRVLNFLDVFYSGDTEGALARCSDDIEFFSNAPIDILPHMGHHRGKDDVRRMWQTVHSRYSEMRYDLPIIVTEADKVAANIRVYFRKVTNGRVVQFDIAAFYVLRDNRITRIREIMDTFDLVQQVLECDITTILTGRNDGRFHTTRGHEKFGTERVPQFSALVLNQTCPACDPSREVADSRTKRT